MVEIIDALFWANMIIGFLLIFGIIISIISPERRIWPPPAKNSWQYVYIWGLCYLWIFVGIFLFILDWSTIKLIPIPKSIQFSIGPILIIAGNILAFWGMKTLSTHQTMGLEGVLIRKGLYRYTRNPQYIGDILILAGFIILSGGSCRILVSFVMAILWFIITPFSEEPWLEEKYGEDYINYKNNTSRYIGFPKKNQIQKEENK